MLVISIAVALIPSMVAGVTIAQILRAIEKIMRSFALDVTAIRVYVEKMKNGIKIIG